MMNWVVLTFLYAIVIGGYNCTKKKAVEKNSVYEVLAWFSTIAFVITIFISKDAFELDFKYLWMILIKALVIVVAWLTAAYAISKMPISLYSVIVLSKMFFSILLSVIILKEKLSMTIVIGLILVVFGLWLVNNNCNNQEKKEASLKIIVVLLVSCLLSSISGVIDKKVLMNITSSQLQFWFLLFISIGYWIIVFTTKRKIDYRVVIKNYWIPLMSITVVIADRLLFLANEIPESKFSVMTIIKQFSTIEIIVLGKIMFNEDKIIKKLACSILIIIGIAIALI